MNLLFLLLTPVLAQMGGVAPGGPAGANLPAANAPAAALPDPNALPANVPAAGNAVGAAGNAANGANGANGGNAANGANAANGGNAANGAAPAPGAGAAPAAAAPAPAPPAGAAPAAVSLDSFTITTVIGGETTVAVLPISATTAYRTTVIGGLLTTQGFQYVQQFPARPTKGADVPAGKIGLGKLSSKGTVGTTKQPIYATIASSA
ncbi:hypothetical protein CKK34_5673 [Yarrowia sp. E02]|nr:hypothetical protein CKK34_5673 [Yarrowia sp. E02]